MDRLQPRPARTPLALYSDRAGTELVIPAQGDHTLVTSLPITSSPINPPFTCSRLHFINWFTRLCPLPGFRDSSFSHGPALMWIPLVNPSK
jgi:hypothetical protein